MAQAPRYDRPTAPVAFRVSEDTRRLLDYVVATSGTPSVSEYVRAVVEAHLTALGFRLVPGITAALPRPLSATDVERWEAR